MLINCNKVIQIFLLIANSFEYASIGHSLNWPFFLNALFSSPAKQSTLAFKKAFSKCNDIFFLYEA